MPEVKKAAEVKEGEGEGKEEEEEKAATVDDVAQGAGKEEPVGDQGAVAIVLSFSLATFMLY